jgi:hypothetical protein
MSKLTNEKDVYHVMSRTALDGYPLKDVKKDFMLDLIKRFSALYFTEILCFCPMGNHFHLLVKMIPEHRFTDDQIKKRFEAMCGDSREFAEGQTPSWREKLSIFQNLQARSRSALPGTTTGATIAVVIFWETALNA